MSKMVQARINALEIENAELRRQLEERPTLRDQFAMAFINSAFRVCRDINGKSDEFSEDRDGKNTASVAYSWADSMLKARDVRH